MKNNKWLSIASACVAIPVLALSLAFKDHKTDEVSAVTAAQIKAARAANKK